MSVSYKKLFQLLSSRNITITDLQKNAGYSANISTRIRRNEHISMESLEKICYTLECNVDDILEFIKN